MKTIKNLKAEEIRKSILQLAIQGKLVKQDPNDEPASELVKRIYAEKQRLIKEGKIKKDKNESYIFKGDDNCYYEKIGNNEPVKLEDLPFDIPDNWTWIRLKNLCQIIFSGKSPKYSKDKTNNIAIGQAANTGVNIDLSLAKYCTDDFVKDMPDFYFLKKNDVLLNTLGHGTLGRCGIYELDKNDVLTDGHLFVFRLFNNITAIMVYKYLFLNRTKIEKSSNGTTNQIFLSLSTVGDYLFPLAPLEEQQRIVDKINSFEPLIQEYDKYEKQLTELESTFSEKLKKSILQYAIEGKLVKQDPNDEPASVLLERIKAEKENLIKEGKIKRDKNETYIYQGDDKKYYEKVVKKNEILDLHEHTFPIPNSWSWCSLSQISKLITDGTHKTPNYAENGVPFISISNISTGTYDGKPKFISLEEHNSLITRCKPELNDILLCRIGTLGKPYINKLEFDFSIFVSLALVKLIDSTMANYIKIVLDSPNTYSYIDKVKVGGGTHTFKINIEDLSTFPIPLPPKKGQIKIIDKINYLFEKIDNLSY